MVRTCFFLWRNDDGEVCGRSKNVVYDMRQSLLPIGCKIYLLKNVVAGAADRDINSLISSLHPDIIYLAVSINDSTLLVRQTFELLGDFKSYVQASCWYHCR